MIDDANKIGVKKEVIKALTDIKNKCTFCQNMCIIDSVVTLKGEKMSQQMMSQTDIEKKIEIEAQNLMYFEHMKKPEAFEKAKQYVYEKYREQISA